MSAMSVEVPYPVFTNRDGEPIDNGYVWVGVANLQPQTNPIQVYFDRDLTQLATQPLRTINGYVSNAGTPSQIYVNASNFSILVQDKNGTTVYSFPNGTGIEPIPNNACGLAYTPNFTGAVTRPTCEKLEEQVSVKDFGAIGDGVTDDTAAIQAALAATSYVYFPEGTYLTDTIRLDSSTDGAIIYGAGLSTVIKPKAGSSYGIQIEGTAGVSYITNFKVKDLAIDMSLMSNISTNAGIYQRRAFGGSVDNVAISNEGSTNRSALLKEGSYTTLYSNCMFGANGSIVELSGLNAADAVTTITFLNCDGDAVIANYAFHCNFIAFTAQGSQNHFQFDFVREIYIQGSDIEGSGDYMTCTANTISVFSMGNSFAGSSGQYRPTILPSANYVFMDGSQQISIQDGSNYLRINNTGAGNLIIAGAGSGTTPKLEVVTAASQSNAAYQAYFHNDYYGAGANGLQVKVAHNTRSTKAFSVELFGGANTFSIFGNGYYGIREPINFDFAASSAPANSCYLYYDETTKTFKYITSAGVVKTITAT